MAETRQPTSDNGRKPTIWPRITFMLPGRVASGGVRVTVEMANRLIDRGQKVRIIYRDPKRFTLKWVIHELRQLRRYLRGGANNDWFRRFRGTLERFEELDELGFLDGEIVIAVGTLTIKELAALKANVVKVRYCHGFQEAPPDQTRAAWGIPMPTIAVSPTLSATIRELSGQDPLAVVPNGISPEEYFEENLRRDGIGIVYSSHYKKDPETAVRLMQEISRRWPDVPLYAFGAELKPTGMPGKVQYAVCPPLPKARELYNRSLIWLVASRSEGFCLPFLEAMSCGAAVLSTLHDSAPGLIEDGHNGMMVPIGDVEGFMEKIDLLLRDQSLRETLVAEGRETARRHTWESAVKKLENFLEELHLQPNHLVTSSKDARDVQ